MSRKLYALFILIGTLGALLLVYLYFFVYYTATLVINTNVSEYQVELFSKSTAQKRIEPCQEKICTILDVSPFDYNISIIKQGYKTQILEVKVAPRRREEIFIQLEKQTILSSLEEEKQIETAQQKIARIREEKSSFAHFQLSDGKSISFLRKSWELEATYNSKTIGMFPLSLAESIHVEYIGDTQKIFISLGEKYYIFDTISSTRYTLPFSLDILYVKPGLTDTNYIVVTQKGSFLYNIHTEKSEFQYLFKDFIYYDDAIIWLVYKDEKQKKSNFNLTEKWNLIVKYTPKDKQRKVLLDTNLDIDRIEKTWKKIIFSAKGKKYELENF